MVLLALALVLVAVAVVRAGMFVNTGGD